MREEENIITLQKGINELCRQKVELIRELDIVKQENEKLSNYKSAWEELEKISQNDDGNEKTAHDFLWFLEQTIQELEQKYNLDISYGRLDLNDEIELIEEQKQLPSKIEKESKTTFQKLDELCDKFNMTLDYLSSKEKKDHE